MTATRRRRPASPARLRVAGIVVLAGLLLAVYAVFVRTVPWSHPWTLSAVFSNSAQITAGSPVRTAGLQVGQVSSVSRGPGTTALVTMQLDPSGRPVHADATAAIRPRLFLEGSYYVDLHPGSPSGPDLGSGRTLPLPQTAVPVSFSTVLSTLTAPVRSNLINIIDGFAHGLARGGARGLNDGIHALGPALQDTAIASQAAVGSGPDDVTRLIEGADRITQALASQQSSLAQGITAEDQVASALASRDAQLTASIRGLRATLSIAPSALVALTRAMPALRRFAVHLDPALRLAPPVLGRISALLSQVAGLVSRPELPRLISVAGPLATQLVALLPRLAGLFPRVRAVSACAADRLVPLLATKLKDGRLTTGQAVWQELVHVNVGLASANQDFDAAGTRVRFATNIQPNLLGLGSVPGVGALLENTEQPVLGIRPQWGGPTPPPAHPEVPCTSQPLGDLQATGMAMPGPAPAHVSLSWPALGRLLRTGLERATAGWQR
jgi:virulence factor Mce-like protein